MTLLLGVKLSDREQSSVKFQKILSKYGCNIGARLGLPPKECQSWGVIILEVLNKETLSNLERELITIDNIELQRMVFN